ncbi:glycosyltransferase family 4 protein [Thalassospira indica]|uniref:Glycosyltransferase family 1 protein n=1 Tax=Thalassospira indica TaxID=1891279 RepID=A0ABN5NEG3_9PROT|nr:glycosyltransferase family 1 protein [Thalassospira indica]AXO13640.1 glycosyltransferase family 1 protein [Thalassospira indica]
MALKIAINASRARSGGAVAHLVGILGCLHPEEFGISEIHVWSYSGLLDRLPTAPWIIKHCAEELNAGLVTQMWWERFRLPEEVQKFSCSILLNVDAGSVCRFSPAITMSRDMLSYEPGEIQRYGFGRERLRITALRYVQNAALRHADGAVFLTHYAAEVIQKSCGKLRNVAYIPHGVGANFFNNRHSAAWPDAAERPVRCLYVSNALPYKHQWHVIDAVGRLRARGFNLQLELVGGGDGAAQARLEKQISETDPEHTFVKQHDFVPQSALPEFIAGADLFIFASSCENMPNTLLEAMAAGVPIACSDRGPMPEVLEDGGVYFDPEAPESIASAVSALIQNQRIRERVAARSRELAQNYSWHRCARETFRFVAQTADQVIKKNIV